MQGRVQRVGGLGGSSRLVHREMSVSQVSMSIDACVSTRLSACGSVHTCVRMGSDGVNGLWTHFLCRLYPPTQARPHTTYCSPCR